MRLLKSLAILCAASTWVGNSAHAQAINNDSVLTTVYNFCSGSGCVSGGFNYPQGAGGLVQATNGDLYGTTWGGGAYGNGAVFGISPSGKLITQYSFCAQSGCPDGSNPYFGLVPATDGNLYGVTDAGGANGYGTVFKITPAGELTTLYSFCAVSGCADGSLPYAGLVQATDGNLYGTTRSGGASGAGTVFKITLSGNLTTLYSFSGAADGANPQATLAEAPNGSLYGTTYGGGTGSGTIFTIALNGTLTTLHTFNGSDGGASQAAFIVATDGNLYGTSKFGGAAGDGTIFEITPSGTFTTLYAFSGSDGVWPNSALVQATDGKLYGTTEIGGTSGLGTIFKITLGGKLATLYQFTGPSSGGNNVYAGLAQATNGHLYGTTEQGGTSGEGTVFRLCVGLCPFVKALPESAQAGAAVRILGTDLTTATNVTFNGVAATFTVASASEIDTTVPAGATSGTIAVTTPGGTLLSNVSFSVDTMP